MYVTIEVSSPFKLFFSSSRAQFKRIDSKVFSSSNWILLSTIFGLVVIIHWCSLSFTTLIPAQELTWVQNVASFVSEVLNLVCIAGNPLSISNVIGLGLIAADHLNIPSGFTNNGIYLSCLFLVILPFSSSIIVYYQFSDFCIEYFLFVVRFIIGWVLIFSKMRAIEVIYSPLWDIIIDVFLLLFFSWGLCDHI